MATVNMRLAWSANETREHASLWPDRRMHMAFPLHASNIASAPGDGVVSDRNKEVAASDTEGSEEVKRGLAWQKLRIVFFSTLSSSKVFCVRVYIDTHAT